MAIIKHIPFFAFLWLVYNLFIVFGNTSLETVWFESVLISGALLKLDVSDLMIILGIIVLCLEIFRATRVSNQSVINHSLSMLMFVVFLVEFIVYETAGNAAFFILTMMSFLDVVAGFTVTLSAARRDIAVG